MDVLQCKKCHIPQPFTDFGTDRSRPSGKHPYCLACRRKENKQQYIANKPKIIERHTVYRNANREEHRAYNKMYSKERRKLFPEKTNASVRASREKHKEKRVSYEKQYYASHREHYAALHRAYVQANRHIVNEKARRYRARKRQAAQIEKIDQNLVYTRDKGVCSLCHTYVTRKDMSLDHVIPLSRGGEHTYKNIALAHLLCNIRKRNRTVPQQQRLFG